MNRELKTDLENILSLVSCAEDYGFKNSILFDAFKDLLEGKLSDSEIEWYANCVKNTEGYGQEDYEVIKEKLEDFKYNFRLS